MESENLQKSRSELIDELLKKYFGFNGFYGFIYFITDGEFIKIGRTSGSVLKRMEQLQTGNARLLKIAGVAIFQQYGFGKSCRAYALNGLEYLYHDFFSENWARGEWFEISEDDLKKCAGISTADDILYKKRKDERIYQGRLGGDWQGWVRRGGAWQARRGMAGLGKVRHGTAR